MFTFNVVVLLSALSSVPHPCDVVSPTAYREWHAQLPKLKIGFCFAPYDTAGVLITQPIGFSLQINEGPEIDLGFLTPLTGPNANGERYYETQTPALAAGVITIKAYTKLLGMSAPSSPISLRLSGVPTSMD
jgi:hypothetical protein